MNSSTQVQSQQDLGIKTLVMFDTETTGLPSPGNKSRITELCFVALLKDELLGNYREIRVMNKLLLCFNPRKRLGPGSSNITGLHNDALEAYGPFKSQANLISSFLKSLPQPACLIAHNGTSFDFPLLVSELNRAKEELPQDILCADSLEAFRELDGLPRIPDYVLKRKHNGSPQKAIDNNSIVFDVRLDECSEMPREQESPRKQSRLSSGERNGWKIEEKTPEIKKSTVDAIKGQHSKRVLAFDDPKSSFPSSDTNGHCATSDMLELFDCECIQVCRCNPEPVTCTDKGDKSLPPYDVENLPSNESPGSVKNIEQKKVSYSLSNMYQRLFGQDPAESHTAESDCLTLLKVIRSRKDTFYQWCNRNAVRLSTIEPMY